MAGFQMEIGCICEQKERIFVENAAIAVGAMRHLGQDDREEW